MPALSTLSVCSEVPGSNTFTDSDGTLALIDPPEWLTMEIIAINILGPVYTYQYNVAPTSAVGTYEIQVNESEEYITVTISNCEADLVMQGCIGEIEDSDFLEVTGGFNAWEVYGDLPEGVTLEGEGVAGEQYLHVVFTNVTTNTIVLVSSGEIATEYMTIQVIGVNCFESYNPCETGDGNFPLNIAWKNRDGAWENYIFYSRKTFKKEIGDKTVFKSTGLIRKYVSIDDVYNGRDVPSGLIPSLHLDKVEEMKYTIQAYLWNEVSANWDIPILIDASSFNLKQEGNGFYEYNFSFIYATQLKVQNQ